MANYERLTCASIACTSLAGPETNPIRIPAERTFERLSNLRTRPGSGKSFSRAKYEGGRGAAP